MTSIKEGDAEKKAGNHCFQESKYREAIVHYTKALSRNASDQHKVFSNRSMTYLRLADEGESIEENAKKALDDADKAIKLDASFVKSYHRRGRAYALLRKFPESIQAFCEGLSRSSLPDENIILCLLGVINDARRSSEDGPAVKRGEKALVTPFRQLIARRSWKKLCTIAKSSCCQDYKSLILNLVSVDDVIAKEKDDDDSLGPFFEFLRQINFNPNALCKGGKLPLVVAKQFGKQIAAIELLRMGALSQCLCLPDDDCVLNAVTLWTLEDDGSTRLFDYILKQVKGELPVSRNGYSPLHLICMNDYTFSKTRETVMIKLLLKGYRPDDPNKEGISAIEWLYSKDWYPDDWRVHVIYKAQEFFSSNAESMHYPSASSIPSHSYSTSPHFAPETYAMDEHLYSYGSPAYQPAYQPPYEPFTYAPTLGTAESYYYSPGASYSPSTYYGDTPTRSRYQAHQRVAPVHPPTQRRTAAAPKVERPDIKRAHPTATKSDAACKVERPPDVRKPHASAAKSAAKKKKKLKKKKQQSKKKKTLKPKASNSVSASESTAAANKETASRGSNSEESEGEKESDSERVPEEQESSKTQQRGKPNRINMQQVDIREELLKAISALPQKDYTQQLLKKSKDTHLIPKEVRRQSSTTNAPVDITITNSPTPVSHSVQEDEADVSETFKIEKARTPLLPKTYSPLKTPWEVRCTMDVWKFLKKPKSDRHVVDQVVSKLHMLANGEFRPKLCRPIQGVQGGIMLYETNVTGAVRLIWDVNCAFSPRLSLPGEQKHVYSQIIRVWHVLLDHDKLNLKVKEILKSYEKGESAVNITILEGKNYLKEDGKEALPQDRPLYFQKLISSSEDDEKVLKCIPPANPRLKEYNIVKFYPLTNEMLNLSSTREEEVDFPFDINPDEFEIINSKEETSTLLLGRSGTGKTTCCLYKMWRCFEVYWTNADVDSPYYQSIQRTADVDPDEERSSVVVNPRLIESSAEDDERKPSRIEEWPEEILLPLKKRNIGETYTGPQKDSACEPAPVSSKPSGFKMLFRLESEEFAPRRRSNEILHHLKQVFITKNGFLCDRMRRCFLGLSHAQSFTKSHREYESKQLPFRLQEFNDLQFPCFLTMRQILLLLDASLPSEPFFERNDEGAMLCRISTWGDNDGLLELLDDGGWDSDLSERDDSGDEEEGEVADVSGHLVKSVDRATETLSKKSQDNVRMEITFALFENTLWPQLKREFDCSYDPALVWTEIKSFIEGSVEAMNSANGKGYLEKEEYENIGRKRAPNFEGSRDQVYRIFRRYRSLKKNMGAYDECDLVFNLYHRLNSVEVSDLGWIINQLFVDETQDFTQAEIALLLGCCQNQNGVFLTGDTAQSIMRGVSFRFKDMQTMFFERKEANPHLKIKVPKVSHLEQNYRSHSGILKVASSVVDLMETYFKDSFDILPKDKGLFPGPKPSYLVSTESKTLAEFLALVLMGNRRKTTSLEFGAHQVILCRSEEALKKLPEELKCAISMTVFDAKGLEFDDVLLFNFFTDSKADASWRIIYSFLRDQHPDHFKGMSNCRPLEFNPSQHKYIESELKHLYTAVTRARCNLWFYDSDENKRRPMMEYFRSLDLIDVVSSSDVLARKDESENSQLFATSTPKEWERRARYFLKHKLFRPAATCFDRAGIEEKYYQCLGKICIKEVMENKQNEKEKLREAALYYVRAGRLDAAAQCLARCDERLMAATVYEKNGTPLDAARLFFANGRLDDALRCWEKGVDYETPSRSLYANGRYEEVADLVQRYNALIEKKPELKAHVKAPTSLSVDRLLIKAAKDYFSKSELEKMRKVVDRFSTFEVKEKFFKSTGQIDEIVGALIREGRMDEVRKLYTEQGRYLEVVDKGGGSVFDGNCYLGHVAVNWETLSKDECLEYLEKAKRCYEEKRDFLGLGCCCLKEAELRKDDAENHSRLAMRARDFFTRSFCWCGEIEATAARLAKSTVTSDQDLRTVMQTVETAIKLCKAISTMRAPEDVRQVNNHCARFYGFSVLNEVEYAIYPKTRCRFLRLSTYRDTSDELQHEVCFEKDTVRSLLSRHVFSIIRDLIWMSRRYLIDCLEGRGKVCQLFAETYYCPRRDIGCVNFHGPFPSDYWPNQVGKIILAVKLEFSVTSVHSNLQRYKYLAADAIALKTSRWLDPLRYLLEIVCPSPQQCCLYSLNEACYQGVLKLRKESSVTNYLLDLIEKRWHKLGHRRVGNINLVQAFWSLFAIVDGKNGARTFRKLLTEETEDVQEGRFWGDPWFYKRMHRDRFLFYLRAISGAWFDAKQAYSDHIIRSVETLLYKFFTPSFQTTGVLRNAPPTLTETNNILEMSSYYCLLALLYVQPYRGEELLIPRRYIETAKFWDCITEGDSDHHLEAIRSLNFQDVTSVQNLLLYVIEVVLGLRERRFNILRFALTRWNCLKSGGAERTLVLCMVLYYNGLKMMGFPPRTTQLRDSFRVLLYNYVEEILSPHLMQALIRICSAEEADRCVVTGQVLGKLLSDRRDELVRVTKAENGKFDFAPADVVALPDEPALSSHHQPAVAGNQHGFQEPEDDVNNENLLEADAEQFYLRVAHRLQRNSFSTWRKKAAKRSNRTFEVHVDSFGCRVCNVSFKSEDDRQSSRNAVTRIEHTSSFSHGLKVAEFTNFRKEKGLFEKTSLEFLAFSKKISGKHILELQAEELGEQVEIVKRETLKHEEKYAWKRGTEYLEKELVHLRKEFQNLKTKHEEMSVSVSYSEAKEAADKPPTLKLDDDDEILGFEDEIPSGTASSTKAGSTKKKKKFRK